MSNGFVHAAWEGDLGTVSGMLSANPVLLDAVGRVPTWDGELTALLAACIRGHLAVVDLLLDAGATPTAQSVSLAVGDGHHAIAERLIARGAPVDACGAAGLPTTEVLERLLAEDPTRSGPCAGETGATPLHYAITVEAVDLLLTHGADIDARDGYHGGTPFQWAFSQERTAICDALRARGCVLDAFDLVALGDRAGVERRLSADPDALDRRSHPHDLHAYGGTLLHAAIRYGREDIARMLLDHGADVHMRGQEPLCATALHWAAFHDRPRLVRLLLEAGASSDVRDASYDGTPLEWAEHNGCAMAEKVLRSHT